MIVCENQQKQHDLLTRATTLAITFLCILLALTVKFDLKTMQLNTVNVFIYIDIDKIVLMRMPLRYSKNGKVLYLNKALYGLQ